MSSSIPAAQNTVTQPIELNIASISLDGFNSALKINIPVPLLITIALILFIILFKKIQPALKNYKADEITIKEPFTGTQIKIKPSIEDKKIAHKIWTELVTRKAALPFQRDKDVIIEVYDSWHTLFQCVREQIAALPVEKLSGKEKKDTENLIDISMMVLNDGLRPHLTEWQAKYRSWYKVEREKECNKSTSPQDIQRTYVYYEQLVSDIENVNRKLQLFSDELKKFVRSNST
ncbi:hypothetical protein [Aeromonas hydrophila]|uniref:hypothetical protein n=1 Tax=Aeromonas hydrophila TaxID=644 RepID=UPI001115FF61|nr:hypothetical protein [Aeromonas hydrophila]